MMSLKNAQTIVYLGEFGVSEEIQMHWNHLVKSYIRAIIV